MLLHATTVAIGGKGVLLRGPSGSGKSDLALRLIDAGARLVADDQTELQRKGKRLIARAPRKLKGLLEVRGVGIVTMKPANEASLALVVDLVGPGEVERMPEPERTAILGVSLARLRLHPFEPSAVAKLRLALDAKRI